MHEHYESLFENLGGCRFLFLYREPVAVLESLSRKKPRYLNRNLLDDGFGDGAINPERNAARHYCAAFERFSGFQDPDFLTVNYAALKERFPEILKHFCLTSDQPIWRNSTYSKSRDGIYRPYVPVAKEVVEAFKSTNGQHLKIAQRCFDNFCKSSFVTD